MQFKYYLAYYLYYWCLITSEHSDKDMICSSIACAVPLLSFYVILGAPDQTEDRDGNAD